MRPADQIEATADRAVADLTELRAAHSRRRRPGTDVGETDREPVSDEGDD